MRIRKTESGKNRETGVRRCWLTDDETESLFGVVDEEPDKDAAVQLMRRCGLRSDEVVKVSKGDIEKIEGEDAHELRLEETKHGSRTTPLPESLRRHLTTMANMRHLGALDPVVDVTPRTIQNWVKNAAGVAGGFDDGADRDDPEAWACPDWRWVTPHDLRRTWATKAVYSGVPETAVMRWGGWQSYSTFRDHYLSEEEPSTRVEYMSRAGLL